MLTAKKPPEAIIEELYIRALSRKPTDDEVQKLVEIINQDLNNPDRVTQLAGLQAQVDQQYRRGEDQLKKLKDEYQKLQDDGQEAAALTTLDNQIKQLEKQLSGIRQRYEGNAAQLVYSDVLWGLFNSTEFAFNH